MGGAPIQENLRPSTLPLRERGLIEEMEEEAREAGLGGWFNGEAQGDAFVESWSGPNSNTLESQDQIWVTNLTTVRGRYLPLPVSGLEDPDTMHQLILLEGFTLTWQQCMINASLGGVPWYQSATPSCYHNCQGHMIMMTSLLYDLVEGEFNVEDQQMDVHARGEERGVNV